MIERNYHEDQTEGRMSMMEENITRNYTKNSAQVDGSQVEVHTLEKNIVNRVRCQLDSVVTTVETIVQVAILSATESLVIPRVELAMKSVNAFSEHSVDNAVPDPDQKDFSGNIEGHLMTTSGRINLNTDLNKIDVTRGNITVKGGDLSINEKTLTSKRTLIASAKIYACTTKISHAF